MPSVRPTGCASQLPGPGREVTDRTPSAPRSFLLGQRRGGACGRYRYQTPQGGGDARAGVITALQPRRTGSAMSRRNMELRLAQAGAHQHNTAGLDKTAVFIFTPRRVGASRRRFRPPVHVLGLLSTFPRPVGPLLAPASTPPPPRIFIPASGSPAPQRVGALRSARRSWLALRLSRGSRSRSRSSSRCRNHEISHST